MQNAQTKPFNRWLSLLLAIIMVVGLIPFGGITTAHAATGDFELPVEGSTGYGITGLTVGGKTVQAGTPFLILGENGSKLKVKLSDGTEGEADAKTVMINLPDVIPSIVYECPNATSSRFRSSGYDIPGVTGKSFYAGKTNNARLGKQEFNVPVLYPTAKKIAKMQKAAMAQNKTLILYEAYRPMSTQTAVADGMTSLMNAHSEVKQDILSWGSLDWFIATKVSNHQKGYAIDVGLGNVTSTNTLTVGETNVTVPGGYSTIEMPTVIHELSPAAATYASPSSTTPGPNWTGAKGNNAKTLQTIAKNAGMSPLASEWWHFNDSNFSKSSPGDGWFEITSNVSVAPANAAGGGGTTDPGTGGGGGGTGSGTGGGGGGDGTGKLAIKMSGSKTLNIGMPLGHIGVADSNPIVSDNSDPVRVTANLGQWTFEDTGGFGFCASHGKPANLSSMSMSVNETDKISDNPVLVNTYFWGYNGEEEGRDAAFFNSTILPKVKALPGFPSSIGELTGGDADEKWRMATQIAVWMALKNPTGNRQISVEGQLSGAGGTVTGAFDESAGDVIRLSTKNNSGAKQKEMLNAAIALNCWATYVAGTELDVSNRKPGSNTDALEYRKDATTYGERYDHGSAKLDFTSDGSLKRYVDDKGGNGVHKQTINGKEYYVIYWMFTSKTQPKKDHLFVELGGSPPEGTVLSCLTDVDKDVFGGSLPDPKITQGTTTPGTKISVFGKTDVTDDAGNFTTEEDQASPEYNHRFPTYFKVCIPVESADVENADIQLKMVYDDVMNYDLYLGRNTNTSQQNFVLGDALANVEALGEIVWGHSAVTPPTPPGDDDDDHVNHEILKIDAKTGEGLPDAVFEITGIDVPYHVTVKSDAVGRVLYQSNDPSISDPLYIPPGSYKVEEVTPPHGYSLDDQRKVQQLYIDASGKPMGDQLVFKNAQKIKIKIFKVDALTAAPLDGAVFSVYKDGAYIGETAPTVNGEVWFEGQEGEGLTNGYYEFEEYTPPAGYIKSNERKGVHVDVNTLDPDCPVYSVAFENDTVDIKLKKVSADDNSPLEGAVFEFYVDSTLLDKFTTDANGEIQVNVEKYGRFLNEHEDEWDFIFKEVEPPLGHLLPLENIHHVQYRRGEKTAEIVVKNSKYTDLRLKKVDQESGAGLPGARFELYIDDQRIDSFTTDDNGEIVVDYEKYGRFLREDESSWNVKWVETDPPPGYILPKQTVYTAQFKRDTKECIVTAVNSKYPDIELQKVSLDDGKPLKDAIFQLYIDGVPVDRFITDENGMIKVTYEQYKEFLTRNEDEWVVRFEEIQPPPGYLMPEIHWQEQVLRKDERLKTFVFKDKKYPKIYIYKYDRETGEPIANTSFKVQIDGTEVSGPFITDENGEIVIEWEEYGRFLDEQNYNNWTITVTEVEVPPPYNRDTQDFSGDYTLTETLKFDMAKIEFTFKDTHYRRIKVGKKDAETGWMLKDALIGLESVTLDDPNLTDGQVKMQQHTGEDGFTTFMDLPNGLYRVWEITPPPGYQNNPKNETLIRVTSREKIEYQVMFENEPLTGLTIFKYDEATGQAIPGAKFEVTGYTKTGSTYGPRPFTTDGDGMIVIEDLEPGRYTVTEVSVPAPYQVDKTPHTVDLTDEHQSVVLKIPNNKMDKLMIMKYDNLTNLPVPGVTFEVTTAGGDSLGEFTTGPDGSVEVPGLGSGSYVVKEIRCPDNMILDPTPKTFTVPDPPTGKTHRLVFYNNEKTNLLLEKIDEETGEPLEDAIFTIRSTSGRTVCENKRTDENGIILLSDLEPGGYVVQEIRAPDGYIITEKERVVDLRENETNHIIIENTKTTGITILKIDAATQLPVPGAVFELYSSESQLMGTYRDDDKDGYIHISNIKPGRYFVKEIKAPDGYILDDEMRYITVREREVATVTVENHKKSNLTITKIDAETGVALAEAGIQVMNMDGGVVRTGKTGKTGVLIFDDLEPGWYKVQEYEAPRGYVLNTEIFTVEIKPDAPSSIEIKNTPKKGLLLKKLDAETLDPLPAAMFEVYTLNDKLVGEYVTDSSGTIDTIQLAPGHYKVKEVKAPEGYLLDESWQYFEMTEGETTKITFKDWKKPVILIEKMDSVTAERLAGAVFEVKTADGKTVIGTYTTDSTGMTYTLPVEPGAYTVEEIKAPTGYTLNKEIKAVNVEPGKMPEVVRFYNDKDETTIIKKTDSVTGDPLGGATFRIYDLEGNTLGEYTTDDDGIAIVPQLHPGSYAIREIKAPAGYMIDNPCKMTFVVKSGQTTYLNFTDTKRPGIQLLKMDSTNGDPLAGAQFQLYTNTGDKIALNNTDENGMLVFENLAPGTYFLRETVAPKGYTMDKQVYMAVLKEGTTSIITATNTPNSNLNLKKTDEEGNPLAGATFVVVRKSDGHTMGRFVTDSTGCLTVENLAVGEYEVTEILAPDGYVIDENSSKTVTIAKGEQTYVSFVNKKLTGIQILKVDSNTKEPLSGATFEIHDANGNLVGTYHTSVSGLITTEPLQPGQYTITETKAPDGYRAISESRTVTVETNKTTKVTFENEPDTDVTVLKVDATTNEPLEGAQFHVRSNKGLDYGVFTTDSDGMFSLSGLPQGYYILSEEVAPAGYAITTQHKLIRITGQGSTITITNTPNPGLTIRKIDAVTKDVLAGAAFDVLDQAGSVVASGTTDASGMTQIPSLEPGYYTVRETKAPAGYSLNNQSQSVQVISGKAAVVTFENQPLATLTIRKVSAQSKDPLPAASFEVRSDDGTIARTATTDATGLAFVTGLKEGAYKIREIKAPEGYMLNPKHIDFNITPGDNVITIENYKQGGLVIRKKNKQTGELLQGARFNVESTDGNIAYTGVTDASGIILTGPLDPGTYIVREISAPEGFLLDSEPQMVEVKKDETRTVEFEDSPLTSLLIEKVDSITKDTLSGARFKITRLADDKVITEGVTDVDGLVLVSDLEPGRYEVREIVAPDGYIQETEPIIANVEMGKVAHVTFFNTPKVGIIIDSVDSDSKKPLSGSTFEIYIQNSVKIYTLTTDDTGRVQTPTLAPGFYVIKQTVVRDGYTIIVSEKTVEVKAGDKPVYVTFESKPGYTLRIENVNINDRNITIADAEFKVTKIDGTLINTFITDINGQIMVPGLTPGWYVVSQTLPGQGYEIVSQTFNIEVKSGTIATVLVRSKPLTGLMINIYDQDTKDGLEGAIFEVWEQNGNLVGSFTSDKTGHIQTNITNTGYYVIKQIKAPDNYTIINAEQTVHLDTHASQTVNFYNTINSNVTIRYEDAITGAGVTGAVFEVSEQNGKYIGEFRTEAGGVIATQILKPGFYVIKLKSAPSGYVFVPETQTIEVRTGATSTVIFKGSASAGLQIEVVDSNNQHIEGCEFEIRTIGGVVIGTYKTEFDGCVTITDLASGYYVIKQIKAPDGFQMDTNEKTIEIKSGVAANVTFTNIKNTGVVIYTSDTSGANLAQGVRFEILRQNGTIVGKYVSDGTGMINVPNLETGYYIVKILGVPDGYVINKSAQVIRVTSNTTIRITFDLTAQTNIKIHLTDSDTGEVISGAKFKVQKLDGAVIGEYTTDTTGYINTELITEGWYTITQVEAAKGYELPKVVMKNVQVITGKASVVEFKNAKRSVMILRNLNKADDSPLSGAKFKLINVRGTVISESIEINHEGFANLPELSPGYYILTQIKAPEGFSINTERMQFRVTTGAPTTITFYNTLQSTLQIMAIDKSGVGIAGLKVSVAAMDGKKLGEYVTEKGGMVSMKKLEPGYYVVTVVSAPDGYTANEESKTVEVKAGEPAKVTFELGKIAGLQIITTGGTADQPIAGAIYTIVKLNGERVGTYKSDAQGLIYVSLQPDTYVVTQTSVPDGYELDSTPRNVTIALNTATKIEYTLAQFASIRLHIVDSSTQKGIYDMRFLLKDTEGNLIGEYRTDDQGYVRINKSLKDGYYTIEALSAPDGYTLDKIPRTIELISGETTEINWTFAKDAGQIQVVLRSQDENEMLGLKPESPISGAVFEIVNPDTYAVVDTIVTGEDGVAASGPLPIGRYILRQKSGAAYYAVSDKEMEVKLKVANDVVRVEYYNRSMTVLLKTEMQSNNNVTAGSSMRIDFNAVNNESDAPMDDFYWQIKVPTDCARAGTLYTGTWNSRAWYKVSYKTNMSDFREIGADLLSTNQNQIDLSTTALGLQTGEYVTDIRMTFGTVPAGFKVEAKPAFYLYVMPSVVNGYKCITRTEIGGKINDEWQTATANWTTNILKTTKLPTTLPKTGF